MSYIDKSKADRLRRENDDLRQVIAYLIRRPHLESGSLEMQDGDEMCGVMGFEPWNPIEVDSIKVNY